MTPQLEIACFNILSAIIAEKSGADRLELCSNIEEGGTSPTLAMVKFCRHYLKIPLYIMVRPRGGNFVYSDEVFEQMKKEILLFKSLKVDGFVFGILKENNEIDDVRNKALVKLASPLPCTFHRAFDITEDYKKSLETVIICGFKTILTSGQSTNALGGLQILSDLVKLAKNRITIMPCGGIRSGNILKIKEKTDSIFYHSSAIISNENVANGKEIETIKKVLNTG